MSRTLYAAVAAVAVAASSFAQQAEISVVSTGDQPRANLDWQAIPGQTYKVQASSSLVSCNWSANGYGVPTEAVRRLKTGAWGVILIEF